MLICDSESDSFKFESTKIWVICAYDTIAEEWLFSFDSSVLEDYGRLEGFVLSDLIRHKVGDKYQYGNHDDMVEWLKVESVCFHNYFQHDKPLIKKFYPWFQPKEEHDSYILSQLFNPDRGNHGLDAWAKRLRGEKEGKVVHEEWDRFSPEMLHRVIDDVKINVQVWEALMKEKKEWEDQGGSWEEAIKIEYGVADLQGRQEMHGVKLDIDKAYDLADEIYRGIQAIDETLLEQMPLKQVRYPETVYEREPFTKAGEYKADVKKWFGMG